MRLSSTATSRSTEIQHVLHTYTCLRATPPRATQMPSARLLRALNYRDLQCAYPTKVYKSRSLSGVQDVRGPWLLSGVLNLRVGQERRVWRAAFGRPTFILPMSWTPFLLHRMVSISNTWNMPACEENLTVPSPTVGFSSILMLQALPLSCGCVYLLTRKFTPT